MLYGKSKKIGKSTKSINEIRTLIKKGLKRDKSISLVR